MCSKPLVTVYITNFNYEKYLKESIESVLNQNFSRIEIIIIDDGSSDSSNEILNYYEDVYGIKVIRNKNKGLTASNNDALNLANGKYIMRLDADDYLHKNAVDLLVLEIEKNDDIVAVFPDYAIVSEDGNVLNFEMRHSFKDDVSLFDSPAHGACTLAKLSILRDAGGYNENYLCQNGFNFFENRLIHSNPNSMTSKQGLRATPSSTPKRSAASIFPYVRKCKIPCITKHKTGSNSE